MYNCDLIGNRNYRHMPILPSRSKRSCCISQAKGVKIIVIVSCVYGLAIVLFSLSFLTTDTSDEGLNLDVPFVNISKVQIPVSTGGHSVQIGYQIVGIGVSQVVSSLCLLYSKRFKLMAIAWIIFQTLIVAAIFIILWNLPFPTPLNDTNTKLNRFSKQLFNILGVNMCLIVFLSLILIEFIIQTEKQKNTEKSAVN